MAAGSCWRVVNPLLNGIADVEQSTVRLMLQSEHMQLPDQAYSLRVDPLQ